MAKQYYIKGDPAAEGPDADWIALTGKEFYEFITSSAGKGRYLIDMDDFMIEATREQYAEWRKEKDHSDYLHEQEAGVQVVSLSGAAPVQSGSCEVDGPESPVCMDDLIICAMAREALDEALRTLDEESYRLICALFLSDDRKTERGLALELGLSQNAVHKREKKILEDLRSMVVKLGKSSQ